MSSLEEISENIKKLEYEINETCVKYNRNRDKILLLPISKYHTVEEIEHVYKLGYKDFGENKVQELTRKMNTIDEKIKWHMVGSMQTNKVKYIYKNIELIHSLDRIKLAKEIDKRAKRENLKVNCLVQINISKEKNKHGIDISETESLISKISQNYSHLRICGLMTIAEYTSNEKTLENMFESIQSKFVDMKSKKLHNVDMKYLSMGMSNDYKVAIKYGSNILRIGTRIFGERNYNS